MPQEHYHPSEESYTGGRNAEVQEKVHLCTVSLFRTLAQPSSECLPMQMQRMQAGLKSGDDVCADQEKN